MSCWRCGSILVSNARGDRFEPFCCNDKILSQNLLNSVKTFTENSNEDHVAMWHTCALSAQLSGVECSTERWQYGIILNTMIINVGTGVVGGGTDEFRVYLIITYYFCCHTNILHHLNLHSWAIARESSSHYANWNICPCTEMRENEHIEIQLHRTFKHKITLMHSDVSLFVRHHFIL